MLKKILKKGEERTFYSTNWSNKQKSVRQKLNEIMNMAQNVILKESYILFKFRL